LDCVVAVIAGGAGQRLGGCDKAGIDIAGRTLIDHVLAAVRPWGCPVMISARADPPWRAATGLPVVLDAPGHAGPLAGVAAGLAWAASQGRSTLLTVTVDCPFLPEDLARRLAPAVTQNTIAVASSGSRRHHLIAGWPARARDPVATAATQPWSVHRVQRDYGSIAVDWSCDPIDPFFNVNTPEDLARARAWPGRRDARP
jgi:molybdopterin-guanine dinucleotide biosynthesis protein A